MSGRPFRDSLRCTALGCVLATSIAAGACTSGPTDSQRSEQGQRASSPTSKLVVLGEDSSNVNAIQTVVGDFQRKTGIAVSFDKSTFEVSYQKANQDLTNGTGLYDIVMQYNFSLSSYVLNKWVLTIPELSTLIPNFADRRGFEADLFQEAWHEVGYFRDPRGQQGEIAVGYPFAANTMLLAYNKQMFDDSDAQKRFKDRFKRSLKPPTSWEDFKDVADFFTDKNKNTYGVALQGATDAWLYYEWASIAFSMGGGVMDKKRGWEGDESTPLLIDSPQSLLATRYYLSLKPFTVGDFFSTGGAEQRELLKKGNVAMGLMWSDYIFPLVAAQGGDRFSFLPIPGKKSGLAGGSFFINRHSQYKKEAADFVLYLMEKDTQVRLAKAGLCSPLRSVYADPSVRTAVPYSDALAASLDRGVYFFEAGPDAEAIQQVLTKWLQRIWRNETSPEAGLRMAKSEVVESRADIFRRLKDSKR